MAKPKRKKKSKPAQKKKPVARKKKPVARKKKPVARKKKVATKKKVAKKKPVAKQEPFAKNATLLRAVVNDGDTMVSNVLDTTTAVEARMRVLWERFERWFAENADTQLALRGPATEQAIREAEATMGITLPESFRASLVIHDGQDPGFGVEWPPGGGRLAPLDAIVHQWEDEQEWVEPDDPNLQRVDLDGRFRPTLRHPRRIPIAGSLYWDQDNMYLDFVPGPNGAEGQVAQLVTECDFEIFGSSFEDFFERFIVFLESGKLAFEPGNPGQIVLANRKHPRDTVYEILKT